MDKKDLSLPWSDYSGFSLCGSQTALEHGFPGRPMGLRREWAHDSIFSCLISKTQPRLSSQSLWARPLVELSTIPGSSN